MRFFTILCYFFAALALITGASDLIQGLASQRAFGATLTDAGFADPMVDNVFRFFSGTLVRCGCDVHPRSRAIWTATSRQ